MGAPGTHYWQRRDLAAKAIAQDSGQSDDSICWETIFSVVFSSLRCHFTTFAVLALVVDPSLLGRVAIRPLRLADEGPA